MPYTRTEYYHYSYRNVSYLVCFAKKSPIPACMDLSLMPLIKQLVMKELELSLQEVNLIGRRGTPIVGPVDRLLACQR